MKIDWRNRKGNEKKCKLYVQFPSIYSLCPAKKKIGKISGLAQFGLNRFIVSELAAYTHTTLTCTHLHVHARTPTLEEKDRRKGEFTDIC